MPGSLASGKVSKPVASGQAYDRLSGPYSPSIGKHGRSTADERAAVGDLERPNVWQHFVV
jgi:hypothetical protein